MPVACSCLHAIGSLLGLLANFFPNGLEQNLVATILREVLHALVYLHDRQIVHGYADGAYDGAAAC